MNKIILSFMFSALFGISANAQTTTPSPAKKPVVEKKSGAPEAAIPAQPSLKKDEYSIFYEDSYIVFKTKKFQGLEISENCFKKAEKPACTAYESALIKPRADKFPHPFQNNIAAINCKNIGGKNLIALDQNRNEYNFCRFSDGSIVNSWSAYIKHKPVPVIK